MLYSNSAINYNYIEHWCNTLTIGGVYPKMGGYCVTIECASINNADMPCKGVVYPVRGETIGSGGMCKHIMR